jgi:GAF domain-containing protein
VDRYQLLANAFVELADTLTADYDVTELTQRLIDHSMTLLPIDAAGIVLGDTDGKLRVLASSSEETRLLEHQQLHADQGPCVDVYRTGEPLFVDDLSAEAERWPAFAMSAVKCRFRSVSAFPLRLRGERLGALNLFRVTTGPMSPSDIGIAKALADVAAISILHNRIISHSAELAQQLQTALDTRLVIEQAKGILAERGGIGMDAAFALLRGHARDTRRRLADLAHGVVDGSEADAVLRSQR